MALTVFISLTTAGTDVGPFDLYSDVDGYASSFETGISKAALVSGYLSTSVPYGTSIIKVQSYGKCTNDILLTISGTTTTTTSTSSTTSTTSTSTSTTTTTSTTTATPVVTFDGFFELVVDVSSTSSYRAQDGSAVPGHFTATPTITPGNSSGTVFVSGTLTAAQGPLVISVPSVPIGDLATIISSSLGAVTVNATIAYTTSSGYLKVVITPNTYPSTVQLSGTLTVTYP